MLHKSFLIVILSLLCFSAGWAETVVDLYESEIPVEDQSPEVRQQAVHDALEEVLDKVASVHGTTLTRNIRDKALRRAEHYIQQYRYTELGLWIRFDNRAIDELLQQNPNNRTLPVEEFLLKVTGIGSLPDYVQVTRYLASLKILHGTELRIVAPDSALFQIKVRGEARAVTRAIASDHFLLQIDEDPSILSFHYSR